ncbi:MAG: membrane protein insertase YidC, partial [Burkholderiales bacterium]
MQTQRTILWVIFTMSLLFLWDAWQRHQGHPSLFGGSPAPTQTQAPGAAAPGGAGAPKADASVPQPGAQATVPTGQAAVPAGPALAAASQPVRLVTDVLSIDIDPVGGEVQRAELLKYTDTEGGTSANVVLFEEKPGHVYVAQAGLVGAPGQTLPNHRTPFIVEPGPRELAPGDDSLQLKMSAEQGGVRVVRTYTLARGSYAIDVKTEVTNVGAEPVRPTAYMQLTRDKKPPSSIAGIASTFVPIGTYGPVVYTDALKFQKVDFGAIEKNSQDHAKSAKDGWIGMMQHYFVSAWVPTQGTERTIETARIDGDLYTVRVRQPLPEIAPGAGGRGGATRCVGPRGPKGVGGVGPG